MLKASLKILGCTFFEGSIPSSWLLSPLTDKGKQTYPYFCAYFVFLCIYSISPAFYFLPSSKIGWFWINHFNVIIIHICKFCTIFNFLIILVFCDNVIHFCYPTLTLMPWQKIKKFHRGGGTVKQLLGIIKRIFPTY
jgi:hypothetical protein